MKKYLFALHCCATLIIFHLFALYANVNAQQTSTTFDTAWANKFQQAINNALPASGIHGVSVAITFPDMGQFIGVGGESSPGVPVTPDMQFGIGSNTKLFTAVLALKLQELGYFSLDDPLSDWVPAFNYIDASATLRECLSHETGFFDFSNDIDPTDYAVVYGPDTFYTPAGTMARIGPPHFPVGEGWSYSNTNYTLVALAIEAATGHSYLENLHQYIFDPLDMDSTFLAAYEIPNGNVCHGWYFDDDLGNVPLTAPYSMYWSAGGIFSTACEMAQWYNHLFEGDIISASSLDQLERFEPASFYGLGIWYLDYPPLPDDQINGHGGLVPGYTSQMGFDVKRHMSISLLTNQGDLGGQINSVLFPLVIAQYEEYTRKTNDAGISKIIEPTSSYCSSPLQPQVILKNFGTSDLTSATIHYQLDNGPDQAYTWNGNLASSQSATVSLPSIMASVGQHRFSAYTSNPNGSAEGYNYNDAAQSAFQVYPPSMATGLQEGFEGSFPAAGWNNGNGTVFDWNQTFLTSYSGDACLVKNMWNDNSGRSYDLDLPYLDLSSYSNPVLSFEYAYGYFPDAPDELEIMISDDCGESFHTLFHKSGKALRTADGSDIFFPKSNEWRLKALNLTAYRDEVIIKFRATSANGNNLYVDNMSVSDKSESCAAPTNLDVTFTSASVAKLSWKFYGQALEFHVYYHKLGDPVWTQKTVNGNKDFVNIQNLSPNQDYEWYIVANCASGLSPDSEISLFTSPSSGLRPLPGNPASINMDIAPNPASDFTSISIDLDEPADLHLRLFSLTGSVLYALDAGTVEGYYSTKVDLSSFLPGIYLLEIKTGDEIRMHKLVVD